MKMHDMGHGRRAGECDKCGATVEHYRGEPDPLECRCGALYSVFGQRLRDDLLSRPNPSEWDDDVDDMTGDELSWLTLERDA
jgi:hypothetical protein